MLDLAARLALRGFGDVEPNPMVGCVIAKDGRVIGMGHHRKFGGLHAEAEALADCKRRGEDPRGATVYVTLEPCNASGKQPPCTAALIAAGVAKVVYAASDPNPAKALGAEALRRAGMDVELSEESTLACSLSAAFRKRVIGGLPWVIAKWAQSIDGKVATRTGDSKWISCELSRKRVHRLRALVDAVLTGIGTVRADDPMLTARGVRRVRRVAKRVVVDSGLSIEMGGALVRTAREMPTLVACVRGKGGGRRAELERAGVVVLECPEREGRVDLDALLRTLMHEHAVSSVLVESGPTLLGRCVLHDLIDEAVVHVAPMVMADDQARDAAAGVAVGAIADARRFALARMKRVGNDVELTYRRR